MRDTEQAQYETSYVKAEQLLLHFIENPPEEDADFRRDGTYKNARWDLVRALKAVPLMSSIPGATMVELIQDVLEARGFTLCDLGYETEDEAIDDLEMLCDKIALAIDEAPLGAAVRMACAYPFTFRTKRISPKYHRFLLIAYHLQELRGRNYICLPVKNLSKILGVSAMRISDYRGFAEKDGLLKPLAPSCYYPDGHGTATKFRFIGTPLAAGNL
jgi:hypothetical protein